MKNDIQVTVQAMYLEKESNPDMQYFVFVYTISIANKGDIAARLIDRHWYITDDNGKIEEVIGKGVVGEQPYLNPGENYTYTSGAVLTTPIGTMKGSYGMLNTDNEKFNATIAEFILAGPVTIH